MYGCCDIYMQVWSCIKWKPEWVWVMLSHSKMLGTLFQTENQIHKYHWYLPPGIWKMRFNKDKWVLISCEEQDRAETQQRAQAIDNPSVSITCAACYHIRQQYDSPRSLTYYVGSHDSCKLHLSRQGPKILWHAITQTHSHKAHLLSHTHHPQTLIGSDAVGNTQWETLESCQSKDWNNKIVYEKMD